MPDVFIMPFDLKKIFINYFLGSSTLFIGAFIIIYSYFAAKMQMSSKVFFMTLVIGIIILIASVGKAVFLLIFFAIALVIFKWVGNIST